MADTFQTLAHLVKINDMNARDDGCSDLLDRAPLIRSLAADEASNGTEHKYLKETSAPVVGFRAVNDGRDNSKSDDTLVTITLQILDATCTVDTMLAQGYGRGVEAYLDREIGRHIKAGFFHAEKQLIYGTANEADGFVGLAEATTLDGLADPMVVDAGGTTAGTGSSVFLIRTNDDGTDTMMIAGNEGMIEVMETTIVRVDGSAAGTFPAYYTPTQGWLGLQYGSIHSIGRIANLTEDAGKGLTDDLIYEALSRFPSDRMPNRIAMNRRSLEQLRKSRTATNQTGSPAPRPTEVDGIQIISTDAIVSTETLLA